MNETEYTELSDLRKQIDEIDDQVLALLNRRLETAIEIGRIKSEKGFQVLDMARENAVISRMTAANSGPMTRNDVYRIFREIICASRELQKSHRVAFLGPEATYTHIAAMNHFGKSVSFVAQPTIRDIFEEVEKKTSHYGVVPVENSIEGVVNHTLDLFFESELKICGEIFQSISHDLLTQTGTTLKDIRTVYSHPQALAQCRNWIRKYLPGTEMKECSSTAAAAREASVKTGAAAIASGEAAHMYHLETLASRIEDITRNTTRFLIIGPDKIVRTGKDKTSFLFVTAHVPGALFRSLQPMANAGINMMKLESRPTRHENWSYFFFVDIEGHIQDPAVEKTMAEMKEVCLYLKWLGSYPQARGSN